MESTIDIISVGGTTNTVVIGQGSVRHYELMSSDYVRLVFSTDKKINIRIGDHIATKEWGTFYITKLQRPTYNKPTGGFDYDLQFDAPYYLWNNRLYKYDPKNNRNEASWSLTDNLKNHMAVFLRSLSYYGWTYTVDAASYSLDEAQRTVYISFQNKYLLDALSQIAEAFNLEYWITDNIIHFGKAESGTAIDFKLGDNVEEMSAENSESDGANRFYAFGSTQNIPSGYRSSESEVVLNGVVQNRLMLPKDTPYIDLDSGLKTEEVVDGIVTFDDVYPHTKSSVSEVIKVSKTVEKSNTVEATTDTSAVTDDSKAETEVVNIYRFKTSDFNFSADYILANTSLQVQFVSGKLNGMTFEVAFNPNGENEKTIVDGKTVVNPDSQLFELVRNDTYGLTLPNDTLCPAVGDKFVLLGWDANKLTAWKELITKAEEELKSKLEAYVAKKRIDPLTYVCTMMSDYMYGLDANGKQDPNFSKVGSFPIGQAIRLHSDVYFKDGMRESRVIGYEYKLDLPFDAAQIYVGESPIYSNSKATQNAINEATSTIINYRGGNYSNEGTGSGNLFVISSADTITAPSDNNVFSAKRSDLDFAHKRKDDRISALWTFSHGHGAKRGVQSQDYDNKVNEDNLFGHGFELVEKTNSQGNTVSRLEIDELLVRTKAFFAELEVRKIAYVGGNYLFSSAGSKVYHVEWLLSDGSVLDKATHTADEAYTFRCYMYSDDGTTATMNGFAADDQVMCRTFNIDSGVHTNVSNKYWWRRCVGVGKGKIAGSDDDKEYQYVDISKADCLENSDYPEAEDVIVQFGNWTDKARQGAIFLMVYGDLAPAILEWENVGAGGKHFVLPDPTIQISPKGNIFYGEFHSVAEKTGGNSGSIDDQINALIEQLNDIKNQADKKFEIWFGSGVPHPDSSTDTESNVPASDWTTDAEKALHAQDLYYDTDKAPASEGGRTWRWMAHNTDGNVAYYWEEVTDKDTNDALDKARELQNQVNGKANVFVSDTIPPQPYKRGDMWIQTANGNNVMICTVARTGTDAGVLSDWADLSDTYDFKGIRTLLATLAEKIYDISGGYIESRGKINVYLYKDGAEMKDGNISFDGNGVARCSSNTWTKIDNAGYTDAFTCVYGVLGSSMLTIYSSKPSSASKYDLVIRKTNWHDPFKNEDVEGNIEILMYNGSSWEMLRESTKVIIDNLRDEIRTVVFGSDGEGGILSSGMMTLKGMSNVMTKWFKKDGTLVDNGLLTTEKASTLYSKMVDADGTIIKTAYMSVYVTKDGNNYISNAKIKADNIELEGLVTANSYFKVLEDGSIEATNATISGTINATKGRIGRFNIGYDGLYAGSWDSSKAETISDAWFDTDNKENICYLNSSSLWLEQQVGYFSAGDMAYMMVGLGRGSDPTTKGDENNYCSSAMYVYRNMMSMDFGGAESYYPAAKIISKNAFGCDIALRVVGGLQVHGGVMEKGYSMEYTASGNVNVLDLSNGTTLLLYTSIAPKTKGHTKTYQSFFFPTLTKLRYQLGISDTATSFSVRVVIIARKDTQDYMICTQKGISGVTDAEAGILVDNNGNEWQSSHEIMGRGDVTIYSLTFTPTTGYYVQLISNAD